jgi:hypothetical protein
MFEGSGVREMVLFLVGLNGSVLLRLFCGGIVSWFSAETRWAPMLGVRKSDEVPEHKSQVHESQELRKGDKESPKACTRLKSHESFYTCPRASFYREMKGFYIPKIPSKLRNIPSVNMYMNVFYIPWFAELISYIYKLATSSHV